MRQMGSAGGSAPAPPSQRLPPPCAFRAVSATSGHALICCSPCRRSRRCRTAPPGPVMRAVAGSAASRSCHAGPGVDAVLEAAGRSRAGAVDPLAVEEPWLAAGDCDADPLLAVADALFKVPVTVAIRPKAPTTQTSAPTHTKSVPNATAAPATVQSCAAVELTACPNAPRPVLHRLFVRPKCDLSHSPRIRATAPSNRPPVPVFDRRDLLVVPLDPLTCCAGICAVAMMAASCGRGFRAFCTRGARPPVQPRGSPCHPSAYSNQSDTARRPPGAVERRRGSP